MIVMSHSLSRGGVFGNWPGLDPDELVEGVDLAVTTDYRQVLAEILKARTQTQDTSAIFPNFTPGPSLGLFGQRNSVDCSTGRAFMEAYQ